MDTNIFDYNGYNLSKENIENEENKEDHINIRKNKDWLKGINKTNSFIFRDSKKYDKHYLLNNYGLKENNLKKPKVLLKHMKENYHY